MFADEFSRLYAVVITVVTLTVLSILSVVQSVTSKVIFIHSTWKLCSVDLSKANAVKIPRDAAVTADCCP